MSEISELKEFFYQNYYADIYPFLIYEITRFSF